MRDVLASGDSLGVGGYLLSPNGRTLLVLQADGNLVVYAADTGKPLWASRTAGLPIAHAVLQTDGNLVLVGDDGHPFWATATNGHSGAHLMAQDDGNVVLMMPDGSPVWDTGTYGYNTTDSVRQSRTFFDFLGSVLSLGGAGTSWAYPVTNITSDPRFVAAAATAAAFAVSGPGGAAVAGAAFASTAGAAIATGQAIQSGGPIPTVAIMRAGSDVADAGDFGVDDLTATRTGIETLDDIGQGLKSVPFVDVKALVTSGQMRVVDEAGKLLGGNPNAPAVVVFKKAVPEDTPIANLYGNEALWDAVKPHIETAYGSQGAQLLYEELTGSGQASPPVDDSARASGVTSAPVVPAPVVAAGLLAAAWVVYKIAKGAFL